MTVCSACKNPATIKYIRGILTGYVIVIATCPSCHADEIATVTESDITKEEPQK